MTVRNHRRPYRDPQPADSNTHLLGYACDLPGHLIGRGGCYQQAKALPANSIGLLGKRLLQRPAELDCAFESICETCTFFQTSIQFRPTLQAQHDDATNKGQHHRADLSNRLLNDLKESEAS